MLKTGVMLTKKARLGEAGINGLGSLLPIGEGEGVQGCQWVQFQYSYFLIVANALYHFFCYRGSQPSWWFHVFNGMFLTVCFNCLALYAKII